VIAVSFHLLDDLAALAGAGGLRDRVVGLNGPAAVKDTLEALGIPHTEVDLLLIDGLPIGFDHRLADGDRVEAHAVPPATRDESTGWPEGRLQPRPLAWDRFVCDRHLGRLARMLRTLGFDTLYRNDWTEAQIVAIARREERAVLTGSRALLKRRTVGRARLIRSDLVDEQTREIVRRFGLAERVRPFARCNRCNGELRPVPKREVLARIPPRTRAWLEEYLTCAACGQLYWEGTHVERMRARIESILASLPDLDG
jgi:uncharacterized protein with PIN domain